MTTNEKKKIEEILKAAKEKDPTSMSSIVNSILANKIKKLIDDKKKEVMSKY